MSFGILDDAKVDPKDCYQCGKCSAGCPVASDADMTPREVLRHFATRANRAGLKIKYALALRWMWNVPGSLPPKR